MAAQPVITRLVDLYDVPAVADGQLLVRQAGAWVSRKIAAGDLDFVAETPAGAQAKADAAEAAAVAASIPLAQKGAANGVATLDANGLLTAAQNGGASAALTPLVYKPAGLRRWRVALGDGLLQVVKQPTIVCIGDSVTQGAYSGNVTSASQTQYPVFRSNGWVTQLRSLLAKTYGDPGEGFIFCVTPALNANFFEERVTIPASSNSNTVGPHQQGRSITSGQTITVATPVCTQISIIGWWSDSTSAPFTYTIDGGSSQNGPTKSGADTMYRHDITGLSSDEHTLVISGPATKRADIGGFLCETGVGVRVLRIGKGGADITSASGAGLSAASQARVLNATLTQTQADLAIVMFSSNDTNDGVTPATFQQACQDIVAAQAANGGCTLLMLDPDRQTYGTYAPATYKAAMLAVADANDHCSVLDINDLWGGYAQAAADGLMQETVHPNSRGHGDLGRPLAHILTGLGMGHTA